MTESAETTAVLLAAVEPAVPTVSVEQVDVLRVEPALRPVDVELAAEIVLQPADSCLVFAQRLA